MLLVINRAEKRKQKSLLNFFFKRQKNDGEAGVNEADSVTLNENPLPDNSEVGNREEPTQTEMKSRKFQDKWTRDFPWLIYD